MQSYNRRSFIKSSSALAVTSQLAISPWLNAQEKSSTENNQATQFQIACMTLPFRSFPLIDSLKAIKSAGYNYVAWGTTHQETPDGKRIPVMPTDASPEQAKELGKKCRDLGLEPVMMFSTVYPEHDKGVEILTNRIRQASAAGIGQVLTFGHTEGGKREVWVKRFKELAPIAKAHNVMIAVKQHGGSTGTGKACAEIIREVDHPSIRVNFDAGNVMDYLNLDPIPDIKSCADVVHSFCIKDHRNWPKDQDCGPGFGEIDHYRLLQPVAFTGRTIPLCCENIFAPVVPRPTTIEGVTRLAEQARFFLEKVTGALQSEKFESPNK